MATHENDTSSPGWLFSRTGIATLVALSVIGFLIYTGHGAHLLGILPYLLILICPLMHIFMHGGHSHHHKDGAEAKPEDKNHQNKGGCH